MNDSTASLARGFAALVCALALSIAVLAAVRWPFVGGLMAGFALFGWLLAFGAQALRRIVSPRGLALLVVAVAFGGAAVEGIGVFGLDPARALPVATPVATFILGFVAALLPGALLAGRLPTLRFES